jgi:hypothetical protein
MNMKKLLTLILALTFVFALAAPAAFAADSYTVGVGDVVQEGQVVGYEGSTGWSTGCHLHFTVMENGTAVDPMKYL